jgi:hypothetical protein
VLSDVAPNEGTESGLESEEDLGGGFIEDSEKSGDNDRN